MTAPNARSIALDCLLLITEEGQFSHVVLAAARDKFAWMPEEERALTERLVHGSVEYLPQLDRLIAARSKTPFRKLKPVIRCILRLSLYQLLYLSRIPAHAVVNEAVKLTERRGLFGLKGFVNAMVRRFVRERDEIRAELDGSQDFALRYALPPWLAERFTAQFGREESEKIAARFLEPAPLTLRLNRTKFIAAGEPAGVTEGLTQSPYAPDSFIAEEGLTEPIRQQLAEGMFFVQDLSSSLAVRAAQPRPGERVLDLCAAPGGKTGHILELADCHVTALDIDAGRLKRVGDNLNRLGFGETRKTRFQTASLYCADARDLAAWYDGKQFDAVLADVPCTASGVVRRNPDIKWSRRPTDAVKTARQQEALLDALWQTLTKNGRMLLATCSVFVEENTQQLQKFLNRHADAKPAGEHVLLPNKYQDGFYYALIEKQ